MTTPHPDLPPTRSFAPPTPPVKKHKALKVAAIVAGSALLLCCGGGAIILAVSGKPADKTAKTAAPPAAQQTTKPADKPKSVTKVGPKVGQAVRDGKFEFTVTAVTYGQAQVGKDYLTKAAQGQFVLVNVTVHNIGKDARMFDGSSQKAKGAAGVTYEHDGAAELYANADAATFLNEINPGNSVSGVVVFDIPKGARLASVELHDSPFSGGVTVDLT